MKNNDLSGIVEATYETIKFFGREPLVPLYPVLGNLSRNVQEGLENITNGIYNANNATDTSLVTNMIAYPLVFHFSSFH